MIRLVWAYFSLMPSLQSPAFPISHPFKNKPRSTCRNFIERAAEHFVGALVDTASMTISWRQAGLLRWHAARRYCGVTNYRAHPTIYRKDERCRSVTLSSCAISELSVRHSFNTLNREQRKSVEYERYWFAVQMAVHWSRQLGRGRYFSSPSASPFSYRQSSAS